MSALERIQEATGYQYCRACDVAYLPNSYWCDSESKNPERVYSYCPNVLKMHKVTAQPRRIPSDEKEPNR